jgi:hypothetical protein
MGFNRRKMEDKRRQVAEKEAASPPCATDGQVLEDAERLIGAWNERQARRMPMIFSRRSALRSPHPGAIVLLVPAERAICRARAPVANQHRGRNA